MTIQYGIIGCGYVAKRHLDAVEALDAANLAVVCDNRLELVQAAAAERKVAAAFTDYRELLSHPGLNAVVVLVPTPLHAEITVAAAARGLHVFVEKPLAEKPDEGRRMIAACRDAGVKLCVGHSHRYFPAIQEARRIIADGQIGHIFKMRAINCMYLDMRAQPPKWHFNAAFTRGPLLDTGIHYIDDLRYLANAQVEHVSAVAQNTRPAEFGVMDTGIALLRLTGGITATWEVAQGQWTGKASLPPAEGIEVYGTEGSLHVTLGGHLRVYRGRAPENEQVSERRLPSDFGDVWKRFHADFLASILENRPAPIPGEEGLRNLEVLDQILNSANTASGAPR